MSHFRIAAALQAMWTICLVFVSMQLPVDLAASDVPAVHTYNLDYAISNPHDFPDYVLLVGGTGGGGNISIVAGGEAFRADGLDEFRLRAVKKEKFDESKFREEGAEYIRDNSIPSNRTFPSTASYVASISVLPDKISVLLRIDQLEGDSFNVSMEKALYHYPDGYREEVQLRGADLSTMPPHHYTRPKEMAGGLESFPAVSVLLLLARVLRRPQ